MTEERWWFDLKAGRAVRDDDRGPATDLLGPYPTQAAAENWKQAHDSREDEWERDDEAWEGDAHEDGPQG